MARPDCFGVRERLAPGGTVVTPLTDEELERVAAWVAPRAAETEGNLAVAVSLLFAFADSTHERRLAAFLEQRFPGLPISVSHRAAPVWREHGRGMTTLVDAYLTPVLKRLAGDLGSGLAERGFSGPVSIMKSNGGRMLAEASGNQAVQTVLSASRAGSSPDATSGSRRARRRHLRHGRTSADIGLVRVAGSSTCRTSSSSSGCRSPRRDRSGHDRRRRRSIAWVDDGIRVGPRAPGRPRPACWPRRHGPTVTDASLVLGRINADSLLGGRLPPTGACRAHMARERLELDSLAAAEAVIEISNEGMASTIRRVAVERGVDPRDFDLVAFGGAGPLHAAEIAASLGMAGVIVPPHPGLASAFGTLLADRRVDRRWTYYARSDAVDRMNKSAPVYAAGQGNAAALDALLAAGIDVNATYDHSLTLLMWAAGQGHADAVRLLLTRGAKPDMRDDRGLTAIIADGRGFHGRDARS